MRTNQRIAVVRMTLAAMVLSVTVAPVLAETPHDVSAAALLQRAAAKLQGANSYRAKFLISETSPEVWKDLEQHGVISLQRPGSWRVETVRLRRVKAEDAWSLSGNNALLVSDGRVSSQELIHARSRQHRQEKIEGTVRDEALAEFPVLTSFFDKDRPVLESKVEPRLLADDFRAGRRYHVVEVAPVANSTVRIFLSDDDLIHRVESVTAGPKGKKRKFWSFQDIELNPKFSPQTFQFKPRADSLPFLPPDKSRLPLEAGTTAPNFTLVDTKGNRVSLESLRGKTVVLDFWASWCWACNQALPSTAELAKKYRDKDVVFLIVVIWDTPASFKQWAAKHPYPDLTFAIDPTPQGEDIASRLYHVSARPSFYVVDKEGKVAAHLSGFDGSSEKLERAVVEVLGR